MTGPTVPCCERDHDSDGNCDRHPPAKRGKFRALIADKGGRDADGKSPGDDWLVASCGDSDERGGGCYVTTDRLHASDVPLEVQDAASTARLIARLLNEWAEGRRR